MKSTFSNENHKQEKSEFIEGPQPTVFGNWLFFMGLMLGSSLTAIILIKYLGE